MATRSNIAIQSKDGKIKSIYCHYDGYPENNGVILINHYYDRNKVEELIELGYLSFLDERIKPTENETHDFNNPCNGVTVAYHRDRGEDLRIKYFNSLEEFESSNLEEWVYLFSKDDKWLVMNYSLKFQDLEKFLQKSED